MSPSRAPVFSRAHYFQAPATQASSLALLGVTMRVTHFCFLTKESNTVETPAGYQPKRHELVEAYGRSVLNTRLGPQPLSTWIGFLPHSYTLGENYCLKFPSYDTRSTMLSRKFPELRHSMQELDATDLNLAILRRGVRFIFPVLVAHAFSYQVRRLFF